jgi:hypothetical protein
MAHDVRRPQRAVVPSGFLALAVGALAVGAVAVGALAIGQVAIGRLAVKKARFGTLDVDELTVRKLRVTERKNPDS